MVGKNEKVIGIDYFSESSLIGSPSADALCLQLICLAMKYHVNDSANMPRETV